MRNIIRLLTYSCCAMTLLLAGCDNSLFDKDRSGCEKELPVSIVASIKSEYNFQRKPAGVPIRAEGKVEDVDEGTWHEKEVEIQENERAIAHIFLFAYKRGETNPTKVILYYPNGNKPTGNFNSNIELKELEVENSSILMNLELYSGFYNFVLIVNSEAALETAESKIPDPSTLQEDNQVLTSDDLTGPNRKYLPMVGQSELYVPNHNTGSVDRPITLNPTIDLERVHARVEFKLTTQKDDGSDDYLTSILPNSEVKSLTLLNEQKKYTVMPSEEDYTVTGKGQTASSNVIRAQALTQKTPMGRRSFHDGTEKSASDTKLDKFTNRLLPYDIDKKVSKYIYVAPSTLATSMDDCLTLDFVVAFPHQTAEADYTHYKIPLYNVDVTDTDDMKRYVTRRNTIYRINAKLYGPDLFEWNYEVINWTNQDVDIPW